jgi:hypothetical protein
VDYNWINWAPKIIIEITPDGIVKLRDPRPFTQTVDVPLPPRRPSS